MQDHVDRNDFAPPPEPAALRGFSLAVAAHLFLLLALTWGVNWKRESDQVSAEAELWSSVPQQTAPKVVQAPPQPAPVPTPAPPPPPPPPPPPAPRVVQAPPAPAPAPAKQPDIALEREKKRQELAERRKEELEQQKKLEARKKKEEEEREKKLEARKKEEEQKRKEVAEQRAAEEQKRKDVAEKAAEEKKKKEELAKAKAKQEEAKLAALRKENMERMMKGASGSPSSSGSAARDTGPSASYAGRIAARIKPNIVFTDHVSGNPAAEVEIRVSPDGTIVGRKLTKSSGVKSWDDAVLRAIDRTEVIPRDTDGRVVPEIEIRFRPRD